MSKVRVIALLLLIAACVLVFQRVRKNPTPPEVASRQCDQALWGYVYKPERLHILNACTYIEGTVEGLRSEPDGDVHIRFRLDPQFESLLNEANVSRQHGDLVLEPVCQVRVKQADAIEPCSRYTGPYFAPQIGQRYVVWGSHVYDAEHGWNELHPITSMQPIQ